jgi:hypothetical protein
VLVYNGELNTGLRKETKEVKVADREVMGRKVMIISSV